MYYSGNASILDNVPSLFLCLAFCYLTMQVFGASLLQGGVSPQFLTVMAACASLCNGAGRIVWGSLSDKYSFKTAITSLCAIQMLLAATISFCSTEEMYFVWVCSILFNVGGFYACFPAACATYFGQANVGSNYGILSIAPGVSALWSAFLAAELTQIFPVVYLTFLVAALEFGALMCALRVSRNPEEGP